jgi:hypothetical protein
MLVAMLPTRITYPLFAAALQVFAEHQPDPAGIAAGMRDAGLATEVTTESGDSAAPPTASPPAADPPGAKEPTSSATTSPARRTPAPGQAEAGLSKG